MKYTNLGRSGITISRITHGCMELGGGPWETQADEHNIALLHTAFDHGVTTFDTAESYGGGHSEEVVGRAFRGMRDRVVLCTKVSREHLHKADVIAACEGSLRRLGTDYIDLYQIHWPDADTPIEESMEALLKLQKQGKIRYIGVSNFDVPLLERTLGCGQIVSTQPQYSLLERDIEKDVLPFCREKNLGVLSYGSLGAGVLTGKFKEPPKPEEGDKRAGFYPFFEEPFWSKTQELLKTLREIADAHGKPVAHVSINWVSQQPGMTSALTGSKNVDQAIMNAEAGDWDLTAEELAAIDAAYDRIFRA